MRSGYPWAQFWLAGETLAKAKKDIVRVPRSSLANAHYPRQPMTAFALGFTVFEEDTRRQERRGCQGIREQAHSVQRRNSNAPLVPPKPNELDMAYSTS